MNAHHETVGKDFLNLAKQDENKMFEAIALQERKDKTTQLQREAASMNKKRTLKDTLVGQIKEKKDREEQIKESEFN